jgi:branched-chain amino acid transport system ATP-binding protein
MLLEISGLHAAYGESRILHDVNFGIETQSIVTLLGRNGSGRSTLLKAMMGLVPPSRGSVVLDGTELVGKRTFKIARAGLGYVPEERLIFPNLTVEENLLMGPKESSAETPRWCTEDMYDYFPRLRDRKDKKAGNLSGGEQQMLTMCRTLLGNPKLLLIDEPTEGLAPKIVAKVMEVILDIQQRGVSILLVEQKLTIALRIAQKVLVMGHGSIVFSGTPQEFKSNPDVCREWLEV